MFLTVAADHDFSPPCRTQRGGAQEARAPQQRLSKVGPAIVSQEHETLFPVTRPKYANYGK
jgi:hypothetical protein